MKGQEMILPEGATELVVTHSDGTVRVYPIPKGVKKFTLTVGEPGGSGGSGVLHADSLRHFSPNNRWKP